jgi:hypothetical protein
MSPLKSLDAPEKAPGLIDRRDTVGYFSRDQRDISPVHAIHSRILHVMHPPPIRPLSTPIRSRPKLTSPSFLWTFSDTLTIPVDTLQVLSNRSTTKRNIGKYNFINSKYVTSARPAHNTPIYGHAPTFTMKKFPSTQIGDNPFLFVPYLLDQNSGSLFHHYLDRNP